MVGLRRANSYENICKSGHFRSATPRQVLAGYGIIFRDALDAFLTAGGSSNTRFPTMEQVQLAGVSLFNAAAETGHVDIFVGHSWSAGRWSKFLALCLFFNLDMAICCAFGAWLIVAATLLGWGGITSLGGSYLALPCLVYFPMTVFFVVFIFGQQLFEGRLPPALWVDKLCIHQTDMDRKAEQIAALPVFVMHSSRMLILWDDTYFERKWCSLELATFARHVGTEKIDVLPLWLAPWLLSSILLDLLSVTLYEFLAHCFPNWSVAWTNPLMEAAESLLGENPATLKFVAVFTIWLFSSISYAPSSFPSSFSFCMKLRNHQLMLQQMANFDVRAAKCTLPSDAKAIEQQVEDLFKDDVVERRPQQMGGDVDNGEVCVPMRYHGWQGSSPDVFGDPLGRFNAYVRGTLREFVISQIGDELYVSWRTCLIAYLPMIFYSTVNVLGCDNGPCDQSAALAGYQSTSTYMLTSMVGWIINIALAFPLTYPVLLRMVKFAMSHGDGSLQLCAAVLFCPLAFFYNYIWGSLVLASLVCVVQNYSPTQLLVCFLVLAVLLAQVIWLFSSGTHQDSSQLSCRCVKRQAAAYEALGNTGSVA